MNCSLSLYTDYLLSVPKYATATRMSRAYDCRMSHDQVTRYLSESYLDSRTIWKAAKPLIREQISLDDDSGVMIVDDSICEKPYTDESALITWHYDHSQGRSVKGINFVSLVYAHDRLCVPLQVTIVEKTEAFVDPKSQKTKYKSPKTKNEYFQEMLKVSCQLVNFRHVLADSWYASADNILFITKFLSKHCVMAVETSRTVALSEKDRKEGTFQPIDQLSQLQEGQALRVYLRSVEEPILLVKQVFTNKDGSQGTLFLIATDLTMDYEAITAIYKKRWKVEEYHKSLKQHTALGASPTKTIQTQANHFFAAIVAFIKFEKIKLKTGHGHFLLKAMLFDLANQACLQAVQVWAA
ncbi:MAG: transposase [Saprospiraceae bacterium]|nr:transposase [Saprospiraceae bacterium]